MTERPLECSDCKKTIKVVYKELLQETMTETLMCADCPLLAERLQGSSKESQATSSTKAATLYCGHCLTGFEEVSRGSPMGCSDCYGVFGDLLTAQLEAEHLLCGSLLPLRRNQLFHAGKTPFHSTHITPSSHRFKELNEALSHALQQENYEEAAWLRDQIKELMDKKNDPSA